MMIRTTIINMTKVEGDEIYEHSTSPVQTNQLFTMNTKNLFLLTYFFLPPRVFFFINSLFNISLISSGNTLSDTN